MSRADRGWGPRFRRAFNLPPSSARVAREVDDELRFHLETREQELIATGLPPDAARAEAEREFGPVGRVAEECRAISGERARVDSRSELLGSLWQDVRYAERSLRRTPAFTVAAVLTVALGIGATMAIFSVVNGVLLRPLPFTDSGRLVQIFATFPGMSLTPSSLSAPEYLDVAAATRTLSGVAAFNHVDVTLSGDGPPERVPVARASHTLFPVLGVRAAKGRVFAADEDRPGASAVIVLGDALWRRRFGADPGIVGRTVRVNGAPRMVVGVLAASARLQDAEAFVPLALDPSDLPPRGSHYLSVVARLRPGATVDGLHRELDVVARRSYAAAPKEYGEAGLDLIGVSLRDAWVGASRPTLLVLLGAVVLLLLLACTNVANLLLVRAESRQHEIAVRAALGAGRARIARQLLTESVLLALAGGALGFGLAALGVRALVALDPGALPAGTSIGMDRVVGVAAAALTIATGVAFGLVPALHAARGALHGPMSAARGSSGGGAGTRLRGALVATELALALVVLVGAGLLGQSFWRLTRVDPGFAREHVLALELQLPASRYPEHARVPAFYARLLEELRALPGVRATAAVSHLPLGGRRGDWLVEVEGRAPSGERTLPAASFVIASDDYFGTMGVPIAAGRGFTTRDAERAPPVAVVSQAMARVYWPGVSPVGRRFRLSGGGQMSFPWLEVVGVAGDVRSAALAEAPHPTYYLLDRQFPTYVPGAERDMTVLLRTTGDPLRLAGAARQRIWALDGELAAGSVRTLESVVSASVARPRFAALVLGAFGAAALALAVTGVYGVLSYAVTRRRREMGVRLALGARPSDVLRLVLGQGMRLALLGVVIGAAGALAGSRLLASLLFGVRAADPITFGAAALVLGAAAFIATFLPARRATRVPPALVLRAE